MKATERLAASRHSQLASGRESLGAQQIGLEATSTQRSVVFAHSDDLRFDRWLPVRRTETTSIRPIGGMLGVEPA